MVKVFLHSGPKLIWLGLGKDQGCVNSTFLKWNCIYEKYKTFLRCVKPEKVLTVLSAEDYKLNISVVHMSARGLRLLHQLPLLKRNQMSNKTVRN